MTLIKIEINFFYNFETEVLKHCLYQGDEIGENSFSHPNY